MITETITPFVGRVRVKKSCSLKRGQIGHIVRMTHEGHYVVKFDNGESLFEQDELIPHWDFNVAKKKR